MTRCLSKTIALLFVEVARVLASSAERYLIVEDKT